MNYQEDNEEMKNQLREVDELYLSAEKARMKEAILKTDTEKFLLFTRMIRVNNTLKKLRILPKNPD